MDQDKAARILKALAEGVDPHSGDAFGPDSPYQHADVVRALYAALGALTPTRAAKTAARGAPGNAGKPWTPEEDERLLSAFESGQGLEQLAQAHGRSRLGVEARLAKLGKLPPPAQVLPSARPHKAREPQAHYAR